MVYQYESERHRHDPRDPYAPTGLRPHEFPSRGGTGAGPLAAAAVLAAFVLFIVLIAAFSGGEGTVGTAPVPEVPSAAPPAGE